MLIILRLIWDDWNIAHIARHKVIPNEVEEVCFGTPFIQKGDKGRWLLTGPTNAGRMLSVVLDPEDEEGVFYPVTARPASRKERENYQKEKGVKT